MLRCRMCGRDDTALIIKVSGRRYYLSRRGLARWPDPLMPLDVRCSALCLDRLACHDYLGIIQSTSFPLPPRLLEDIPAPGARPGPAW
jgi:hypothetical protein